MPDQNRFREAIKENFNVLGLATLASVSMATINPLPLIAGLVAEAAYLLFVPDSKWYTERLSRRNDAEVERRRQQIKAKILPTLREDLKERYLRLERMRGDIHAQGAEDAKWFLEVLRKLDYLLEKFLLFASKEEQFRAYLRSMRGETGAGDSSEEPDAARFRNKPRRIPVNPRPKEREENGAASPSPPINDPTMRWIQQITTDLQNKYRSDMDDLKNLMASEQDSDTKAVLAKRLDVLQRRSEFVGKSGKILVNLHQQLELVEDTFGLINDEIRGRSPEQVLTDIDEVVWQTDSMTQVLEQIGPIEQSMSRLG
jgi:hypothetical protein